MITIEDIEALNPGNHIAAEYSDLYKAVYGSRPYGELVWESVEDFDKDWNFLIKQLNEEEERFSRSVISLSSSLRLMTIS